MDEEVMCEIRVIMEIPDQDFGVIINADDDNVELEQKHGTILLLTGAIQEDPDALMPFGVIGGEKDCRVAFWEPFSAYNELWQKMLAMKKEEMAK